MQQLSEVVALQVPKSYDGVDVTATWHDGVTESGAAPTDADADAGEDDDGIEEQLVGAHVAVVQAFAAGVAGADVIANVVVAGGVAVVLAMAAAAAVAASDVVDAADAVIVVAAALDGDDDDGGGGDNDDHHCHCHCHCHLQMKMEVLTTKDCYCWPMKLVLWLLQWKLPMKNSTRIDIGCCFYDGGDDGSVADVFVACEKNYSMPSKRTTEFD